MVPFSIHTTKSAPQQAKPILEQLEQRVGFLPNLAAMMAENPLLLETYVTLGALFGRGSFSPADQQIILMVTALGNQCTYCMAAHSTFAKVLGVSDTVREAIRTGKTLDDPRLAALVTFTHQTVRKQGRVSAEDIRGFLEAGFTQAQALEVLIGISQGTLASLMQHITHTPLDEGFQPEQWTKSA